MNRTDFNVCSRSRYDAILEPIWPHSHHSHLVIIDSHRYQAVIYLADPVGAEPSQIARRPGGIVYVRHTTDVHPALVPVVLDSSWQSLGVQMVGGKAQSLTWAVLARRGGRSNNHGDTTFTRLLQQEARPVCRWTLPRILERCGRYRLQDNLLRNDL